MRRRGPGSDAPGEAPEGGGEPAWAGGWESQEEARVARWLAARGHRVAGADEEPATEEPVQRGWAGWAVDDDERGTAAPAAAAESSDAPPAAADTEPDAGRVAVDTAEPDADGPEAVPLADLDAARLFLEREVLDLQEHRRRLLAAVEAAEKSAADAARREADAQAAMVVAEAERRQREEEHFALWTALDGEVAALQAQRRRLLALRRRHRRR